MVGPAFMISPVLAAGAESVEVGGPGRARAFAACGVACELRSMLHKTLPFISDNVKIILFTAQSAAVHGVVPEDRKDYDFDIAFRFDLPRLI